MTRRPLALFALLALAADAALAESLAISSGWIRESIPGQAVTAAYLQIANGGAQTCRLTGASAAVAARVEIHEHQHQDGQMRMRQLQSLEIPAGETRTFKPGGLHLMLLGLKRPLAEGEDVTITFITDSCGDIGATLPVARMK